MKNNLSYSKQQFCYSGLVTMIALFFSGLNPGFSQVTVVESTTVKIAPGSTLNALDNFVLKTGGNLDVQGTLILKKNLVNQNSVLDTLGSGTIVFSGSIKQSISGQNVIQNLELANSKGLTVAGNTKVNGTLTLTNGLVTLGDYNLLLGSAASVSGSPSSANMVVPTLSGQLQKEFGTIESFIFPVGDSTGTAEYSPVTLTFSSGTFGANNHVGVNLVNNQYPGTSTSYLSRYWVVSQSNITNFACNATFKYNNPADVHGNESDIFSFRVLPAPFTAYNASNTSTNEISIHGLASFGTFTGNLGNAAPLPPVRSLQDKTISSGPDCADATQTLLIAGNGTSYWVQSTGNVKHIAGSNIIYYPGTKVDHGGYMHGYISTTFCTPYIHPGVESPVISGIENSGNLVNPGNSFFKIYPNPTPGKFTLELNGDVISSDVHVEIFGVLGDRVLSKDLQIERKQEFSLIDKPTGVYVIHVTSGQNSETEKIIKR